jgi:hypothetical protein
LYRTKAQKVGDSNIIKLECGLVLVRVQPVKSFIEWPKFEGFKSLTPLGESEKKPVGGGSTLLKTNLALRRKQFFLAFTGS